MLADLLKLARSPVTIFFCTEEFPHQVFSTSVRHVSSTGGAVMSPGIVASLTFAVIGPWGPVVSYQYSVILMINMIISCSEIIVCLSLGKTVHFAINGNLKEKSHESSSTYGDINCVSRTSRSCTHLQNIFGNTFVHIKFLHLHFIGT